MNIWIDLANSPQVLFFRPLIPELQRQGHVVTVTTRNFAQTVELSDHFGLLNKPIGGHGGKKISNIGFALGKRAWQLAKFAKGRGFDLAISHNSYAQAIAAKLLRIPFVTSMDYEHQPANHICFRLAHRIVVPQFFPDDALRNYGAKPYKVARYHGTKEEVYLGDFKPQTDYLESVGMPADRIIAVLRPPGTWGLYHDFENPLFENALEHVANIPDTHIVFLPRVSFQSDAVNRKRYPNVTVPTKALDGPNILYHADLVISGGGTMNREAAVLGTPTYSLFKGKLAAVDRYLIKKGRMKHIDSAEGVGSIQVQKKSRSEESKASVSLVQDIVKMLLGK